MTNTGSPRVGVFHPGTQHSLQTALAFQEGGNLAWHATSAFYDPARWPYRIERYLPASLAARLTREFRRRYDPELRPENVRLFGFEEWAEVAARRLKLHGLANVLNAWGNTRFGRQTIRLMRREPVDVVWGYNGSSLEVFRWARARGIRCVLDQTIGHPRSMNRMYAEEYARHPQYFLTDALPNDDTYIAMQEREIALADIIVCGSPFCAETMVENGVPREKLRIVPYGFNDWLFHDDPPRRAPLAGRPVKFLFAGTVEARKGVPYLLEAFARVPPEKASLTLIGRLAIPESVMATFAGRVRHIGQIPRAELIAHYLDADCFIFPSLFEGSALVLYEAIAAGLGIIQSRFSGVGVRDGENGISLEHVSVESILSAVRRVIDDPSQLQRWQEASWQMRSERSWFVYRRSVRELIAR